MRCPEHGPPTLRQRRLNVAATLARPWRELGEELGVGVLERLARVDTQFLAQQDPEAFIGRKRLGHVASRRQHLHQQQMSCLTERCDIQQFPSSPLRSRQLRPT